MKTYIQIGAGGTGSHLIAPILAYLETKHRGEEWQYIVVDGDNFDTGNLERQLFDPTFVASNKAEAMVAMYNRYPVLAVPRFIGKDDLQTMMDEGDTVLICADNHSIRALVQERALELQSAVVINAGNEYHDGNIQLFVREDGVNKTPPITFLHPEIRYIGEDDRQPMSCAQVAQLPGGGQLILANMAAAQGMLTALWRFHEGTWTTGWTEWQFDLAAGTTIGIDMRPRRGWAR
jgi:hypothetical protein